MDSPLIVSLKKQQKFYGSKIKLLSPAKINLYLNIIGKYKDGFHRIESVAERISLSDEIYLEVTKSKEIRIASNINSLATKQNIIVKAIRLLREEFNIQHGFNIFLKKNIPVGSGLGGGSSNAASVLIGLNNLLNLRIKKQKIYDIGAKIGSDVNFFLAESPFALLEERGQKVSPLDIKNQFYHFIIWPGFSVSTKKVYAGFNIKLTKFFNSANILQYALKTNDVGLIKKSIFNALENKALATYKKLRRVRDQFEAKQIFAAMSGSGSAFYTIFDNLSLKKIKDIFPERWTIFKARTF